ncbi:MAG: type II toxin-antitoxin system Phd/YefM family antitoxin [Candidatus Omnitrophica bacterium]|nr:type II toxin-antitoxin system Phd/YefM family antitoxin [Candidatus Omnitrophota bacterium]
MTKQINIHEAKTHFSQLLAEVQNGMEIIIAKAGTPVARLTAIAKARTTRKAGSAKTLVSMSPDFDALLPEDVLNSFEQ